MSYSFLICVRPQQIKSSSRIWLGTSLLEWLKVGMVSSLKAEQGMIECGSMDFFVSTEEELLKKVKELLDAGLWFFTVTRRFLPEKCDEPIGSPYEPVKKDAPRESRKESGKPVSRKRAVKKKAAKKPRQKGSGGVPEGVGTITMQGIAMATGLPYKTAYARVKKLGVKPFKGTRKYPRSVVEQVKELGQKRMKRDEEYMKKHRESLGPRRPGVD